ncbi:PRC-barrel domain-containing protein [Methanoculleus bourgensis]|uniref:PRC-barrel domain-containing protein n=1 Tax=Methanoculleus bourgensis TaxID=83986 RepID=UPI0024926A13|nr:PRC-barrel domain-containing protein [Methanoculleus bourgensis]
MITVRGEAAMQEERAGVLSASAMMRSSVRNPQGEDLGKIEDLALDLDAGRIAYAVISFGGFLGLGEKHFAIPWEALRIAPHEHAVILDMPKERLKNAPGFERGTRLATTDQEWLRGVYTYYGYRPYWEHPPER